MAASAVALGARYERLLASAAYAELAAAGEVPGVLSEPVTAPCGSGRKYKRCYMA